MFDITRNDDGSVLLSGRLDAAAAPVARDFLLSVDEACRLDFSDLIYIASAGLGILVAVQRRLMDKGESLSLFGLSPHLKEVLVLAGFEGIFKFE